jgi:hypothetical protein
MMFVVVKMLVQFFACTKGVVNASGDVASAGLASDDDVVSDMEGDAKTVNILQWLCRNLY